MQLVLVAEDEYGNAEVLRLLLEAMGYRVALASNGQEALALVDGELPAAILSDFMMPVMNGAEFGRAVRRDPRIAMLPFILISGTRESIVQAIFDDYDLFLPKPIDADVLERVLQAVFEAPVDVHERRRRMREAAALNDDPDVGWSPRQ